MTLTRPSRKDADDRTADPKTLEPLNVFVGVRSMATSFASNAADARVYVHQCSAAEREVPWVVIYICAQPVPTAAECCVQQPVTLIEEEFEDTLVILRRRGPSELVMAVQGGGELPHIRTAGHHPADVVPTRMAVRDQLGLSTVVLGCRSVGVAGGVVRRLLALESLDDSSDTTDFNWVGHGSGPPSAPGRSRQPH